MSKRLRPSLKDYLKTGEVRLESLPGFQPPPSELPAVSGSPVSEGWLSGQGENPFSEAAAAENAKNAAAVGCAEADEKISIFLDLLSEFDRRTWEPVLRSGTEIRRPPFNAVSLREDFRLVDRTRFTYYILDERNAPLRPVRTSVQIREPFVLLLKWDETGVLDIYGLP